jgi:hypothetical protein
MSDYNEALCELHQEVVQDELGLSAAIDEDGRIQFKDPDLGELIINLREYNPEYMNLHCVIFGDYKGTRAPEDILRVCNSVNCSLDDSQELARLKATFGVGYNVVRASVAAVLAAPRRMPEEALLRAVIVRALSSVKAAAKEFADELGKLT